MAHEPHEHAEWPGPENDGSLAYRLEDYLMSGGFLMELDSFAKRHASKFEIRGPNSSSEHEHEWFEAFKEYETMLDQRSNAFLASEQVTAEQAVAECFRAKDEGNSKYKYFEYLAAAIDYERFHVLMLDFKTGRRDLTRWWECLQLQE
eukprot:TRINITY_DN96172_c0_g1_i1.p1 TRINITY_DN96172_c0_g1~~TRINITY_DN96172_c0_g1_i1.p1  ORF type:complete len:157 (+),score=27.96 TRINITY_DN96172_c0_g1_i1:30-473(+)